MNANPFTSVKDKFFSQYLANDDQKNSDSRSRSSSPNPTHRSYQYSSTKPYTTHSKQYHSKKNNNRMDNNNRNNNGAYHNGHGQHQHSNRSYNKHLHKHRKKDKPKKYNTQSSIHQRADVIADYLEKVPLLARLSREDRYNLGKAFKQKIYSPKSVVIKQGEQGHEFFIITKGDASVIIKTVSFNHKNNDNNTDESKFQSDVVATLHPGDYFGETALLMAKPRNATVQSNEGQLHCLVLDKETFITVFGRERVRVNFGKRGAVSAESFLPSSLKHHKRPSRAKISRTKDALTKDLIASAIENNVLFAALDEDQINRIVDEMWSLDVNQGENLINQGDSGDNFYVVEDGTFNIYVTRDDNKKLVATRTNGESFGELALMYNSPRSATVTAMTPCKVWAVERYMFRKILIRVSEEKLKEYERFLKHVPLLDSLLVNERRAVSEALNEVTYNEGDTIVEQGQSGDTFYIIKKGEAIVYKSVPPTAPATEVARLKEGSFFGERALVKNETRAATVTVVSKTMKCLTLDREAFCLLLGPLAELMHRKIDEDYDGIKHKILSKSQHDLLHNKSIINEQKFNDHEDGGKLLERIKRKKIRFEDLNIIGLLGRGSFGSVELVSHKSSSSNTIKTYALKSVSKSQIVRTGQQEHIISEKNVMIMLDSPFIVKLYETYNSDKYLYFLLEVVLGGELFTVLRARTVFDEPTARFYTASVVFAFDYMHSKSIIYRDLKPENLLLDSNGYLKITDFGFAKIINDRTYTLCGTPDYLSPEVISGAGHGKGVDWWTLGVLLFEMLASYPPFYHEDPMKTYAKIMYGRVNYPKHFSKNSVDIIKAFLSAKPTKRLGIIKGGIDIIKQHKWFAGDGMGGTDKFDWDALFKSNMVAPIIPSIRNERDRSNFETSHGGDDEENEKLKAEEKKDADQYVDDGSGWDKQF